MVSEHRPTKEELDERVVVAPDPAEFIGGVLAVKPEDDANEDDGPGPAAPRHAP
jgi:hypothetical protein